MDDRSTRLGGEEDMSGRGEERLRDYAGGPPDRPDVPGRSAEYAAREHGSAQEADREPRERVQEIRAEIEQTREDLSETIDAIQEKLRPRNLVAQATGSVKRATREGVKSMGRQTEEMFHSAGGSYALPMAMIGAGAAWLLAQRAQSRGESPYRGRYDLQEEYRDYEWEEHERGGGVVGRIRNHPVPAALVGAGLAWLALAENGEDSRGTSGFRGSRDLSSRGPSAASLGSEGTEGESLADRGREMAERLGSRAEQMTENARDTARRTTRRAQNGLQRLMQQNPLMVGAAAAVIGAAVGLALPETERENEWLGEAKETVVDRAQDLAKSAADRAREAAGEVIARTVTGSD